MRAGGGHATAVPLQGLQGQCDTGILADPGHCLLQDTAWIFLLAKRIRPSNTELGAGSRLGISHRTEKDGRTEVPLHSQVWPLRPRSWDHWAPISSGWLRAECKGKHQPLTQHCPNSSWPTPLPTAARKAEPLQRLHSQQHPR